MEVAVSQVVKDFPELRAIMNIRVSKLPPSLVQGRPPTIRKDDDAGRDDNVDEYSQHSGAVVEVAWVRVVKAVYHTNNELRNGAVLLGD